MRFHPWSGPFFAMSLKTRAANSSISRHRASVGAALRAARKDSSCSARASRSRRGGQCSAGRRREHSAQLWRGRRSGPLVGVHQAPNALVQFAYFACRADLRLGFRGLTSSWCGPLEAPRALHRRVHQDASARPISSDQPTGGAHSPAPQQQSAPCLQGSSIRVLFHGEIASCSRPAKSSITQNSARLLKYNKTFRHCQLSSKYSYITESIEFFKK